ncbi:hypothetical protein MCM47_15290 [Kitasatospora sp. A2-31]|nr:hypothetical protein [Kitasatospora sp. A2-31]
MPTCDRKAARSIVTAVLRAGVAWTLRGEERRAWREVSRMHGVVLSHLSPGLGPATPAELVDLLQQQLSSWIELDWEAIDPNLGSLTVLHGDSITDGAVEAGGEYVEALLSVDGGFDNGSDWLPSWAWQTAEQVERTFYRGMKSLSAAEYSRARAMVIEVPCGTASELLTQYEERQVSRVDAYEPIARDRLHVSPSGSWFWPCPGCRYPMLLRGGWLRCEYPPHDVYRYSLAPGEGDELPVLAGAAGRDRAEPRRADGVLCLAWGIWRFICCPGLAEVSLMRWLEAKKYFTSGRIVRWENRDAWDIGIYSPDGWQLRVDVKDVADPRRILDRLPAGETIVLPWHRAAQARELAGLLASVTTPDGLPYEVLTDRQFRTKISGLIKKATASR